MNKKFLLTYIGFFVTLLTVFQTKPKLRIQNKTDKTVYCSVSELKKPRRKFAEIPASPDKLIMDKTMTTAQKKQFTYLWEGRIKIDQGLIYFEVDTNGNVKCWKLDSLPLKYTQIFSKEKVSYIRDIDRLTILPNGICEFFIMFSGIKASNITMTAKPIKLKNIFW